MICSRLRTAPASEARKTRRSYSFGVRSTGAPRTRLSGSAVDAERTDKDLGGARDCWVPDARHGDRTDSCHQFPEPERLHDVVVGTELEQHHTIDLLTSRGDDDDRHAAVRS